jgi:hypothetical protein
MAKIVEIMTEIKANIVAAATGIVIVVAAVVAVVAVVVVVVVVVAVVVIVAAIIGDIEMGERIVSRLKEGDSASHLPSRNL